MKNKLFFIIIFLVGNVLTASAQQKGNPNNKQTIFKKATIGQEVTLNVDLKDYDLNTIGQLKDDLFQFQYAGKISLILLDEFKKVLTIKYNDRFLEDDLVRVFYDNKVDFLLKVKTTNFSEQ